MLAFGGCEYIDPEGRLIATSNAAVTTRMQVSTSVLCGNMKSLHHGRIRADVPHARQDLPCLKSVICD
ncbi:MAG: hypothetical protein ABT02_21390 [Comamonadaceae bacterium SCN 68-20]|nr:MAG: hypothetical protein ABT02_21390 [Comamonadaceae bacterium SCN 68-20]